MNLAYQKNPSNYRCLGCGKYKISDSSQFKVVKVKQCSNCSNSHNNSNRTNTNSKEDRK